MTEIIDIHAREILDSRGNPTVEVEVTLEDGSFGRAAVPSGASTGAHEAVEKRDGDKQALSRQGRARRRAERQRRDRRRAARASRPRNRSAIDEALIELDDTPNKSRLGANAILGVSLAVAKAAADASAPAALPLYRRRAGARAAGADDEHHQWRRACRQSDRLPGIHDPAGRRADRARGDPLGRGNLPYAESLAEEGRPHHLGRRRGRLRAEYSLRRGGARLHRRRRSRPPASCRARTCYLGADVASTEFFKDGKYVYEGEKVTRTIEEQVAYLAKLVERLSDRHHRRRHGRGRLGRAGAS